MVPRWTRGPGYGALTTSHSRVGISDRWYRVYIFIFYFSYSGENKKIKMHIPIHLSKFGVESIKCQVAFTAGIHSYHVTASRKVASNLGNIYRVGGQR